VRQRKFKKNYTLAFSETFLFPEIASLKHDKVINVMKSEMRSCWRNDIEKEVLRGAFNKYRIVYPQPKFYKLPAGLYFAVRLLRIKKVNHPKK